MPNPNLAINAIRETLHDQCKDMEPVEYMEVLQTIASDIEGFIDALKDENEELFG